MRTLSLIGFFIMSFSLSVNAQMNQRLDSLFILPDTVKPFTLSNLYELILANHPVARQASLLTDVARQEIRLARGSFDPKIEAELLKKNFDEQDYYLIANGAIKFPTIIPINPSVGIERNEGTYLNPERYISDAYNYRQFYAGFSVPLGRGLLTDDRRAALRQAELFQTLTQAEQVKIINKLLLEAAKEYWQWYYAYYNYRLISRNVSIATTIFNQVKMNVEFGELAPVDSLQAKITWQQRLIEQQEALLDFQNTGIHVSTFLWDSVGNPLALSVNWAPVNTNLDEDISQPFLQELFDRASESHPELQKVQIKLQQLEIDRRLAAEYLKPQLNLSYYFLNQPFSPELETSFTVGKNYKLGLDFSIPIFLRKERSKLALAKLKLSNTQFEQTLLDRQIRNEIQASYNQITNFQGILQSQQSMVLNFERLVQAELLNLNQGESDLFKINIQLEKLIQSQSKQIKLMAELEKERAYLFWAAGISSLALESN